jgi:transglutaminase-like putative cysteine protease
LRGAGQDYPSWVTERYLQLPETITPRTRQRAEQIASGLENPYDITQAVTDYLRTTGLWKQSPRTQRTRAD